MVAVAELEVLDRRQEGHLMLGQVSKRGRWQSWLKGKGQMRIKEREQGGSKRATDPIGSNC